MGMFHMWEWIKLHVNHHFFGGGGPSYFGVNTQVPLFWFILMWVCWVAVIALVCLFSWLFGLVLFVCLFICLSVYCLLVCWFVGLLVCWFVCLFVCLFRWSMVDVASDLGWFHSDSFDSSCFPVSCRILQSSLDAFWGSIWPNWPQALINLSRVCRGTEKNMLANTSASSCNPLQIGFGTS